LYETRLVLAESRLYSQAGEFAPQLRITHDERQKKGKSWVHFRRKNSDGSYRLEAGVWRGPGEQIIPLTSLQQRIALLFLESSGFRLSADQIQEKLQGPASDSDPRAYRKHVALLNGAFGFPVLENERNSGAGGGDSKNRRALYFLSPSIEFLQPLTIKSPSTNALLSIPLASGIAKLARLQPYCALSSAWCPSSAGPLSWPELMSGEIKETISPWR
jgi:hypothetical protein